MVTKKDINQFRANYESRYGHVDDVSHTFGWASHEKFYETMKSWHSFVDSLFPDYFPFNTVQGVMQSVIDYTYDSQAENHYNKGVDMGRQLIAKANEIVNWAQNQITATVEQAKAYIQNNLINPITNTIDSNINPALADAKSKINNLLSQLSGFDTRVQNLIGNMDALDTRVIDLNSLCTDFDKAIKNIKERLAVLEQNSGIIALPELPNIKVSIPILEGN